MAKKMLIDATHAEETRVVVVDGNKVEEFDFESENKRQLAGNIYLAKVTRVEPSLQAAFVDYGGNRHGFLAFSEIHPDYYQIPVADREALLAEERAYAASLNEDDDEKPAKKSRSRSRSRSSSSKAAAAKKDAVVSQDVESEIETEDGTSIPGMDVVDVSDDEDDVEGSSPMELVGDTPVETPSAEDSADESDDDETLEPADKDSEIESVAEEDVTEEIRQPRKPRPRRYKIQEVIKVRQILLVQVVKEERGNKGAALTTYLSLAGRYCVLMPNTARGGGISRKITNAVDRKKLKEIANEIDVPEGAGLIIRTAGAKRTKSEIKRDYEYLQRLWEQIRELTLKSIAPAPIYEEGNLIKRSIRDLYNREIDEVIVEGPEGYRTAKDFMKMIMPSHAKNVKQYTDPLPLFARYQVESYLGAMFNPTVQLKSGGYIVIGVTEALVAIDVNSGRATKEGSIEETALKTNLEAAEEVARQLRLRDLAGLIVIDFIDMEERRNNAAVEKRMKDKLKTDRARIQVGRISGFGLMEMSRQRLRPGMIEATTQPCTACHGTGLIRSDDNLALSILRQLEEEGVRGRSREVLLKAPIGIVNFIMNQKREHIAQIESRYGLSVRVEADPHLVSPDFTIERFKTATRAVVQTAQVVSVDTSAIMKEVDEEEEIVEEAEEVEATEEAAEEQQPKKRRRRRRRRRSKSGENGENGNSSNEDNGDSDEESSEGKADAASEETADKPSEESADDKPEGEEKPKRRRSRSRKKKVTEDEAAAAEAPADADTATEETVTEAPVADASEAEAEVETEAPVEAEAEAPVEAEAPAEPVSEEAPAPAEDPAPEASETTEAEEASEEAAEETAAEAEAEAAPEPAEEPVLEMAETAEAAPEEENTSDKPKRRGWWSV
ncbi:ribonuclease E/G [Pseudoruegeria sp. SHC-113]|uniref:Rne/Rng family ribonuclease n=1 Tax=Pseudoruegeria sp. SHC-113 TaxID=2855439 RepID=UPI0021BA5897|nr:ribonuclease E/G [Pseudoruegeria sp. SHC-113]MCT8160340.1 ribonuclease E/G [Pseudoruegeria sp. SHC-113]